MSSPPWQDRRFMFPAGKQVHEPARRPSIPESGQGPPRKPSITNPGGLAVLNPAASSSPSNIASKNIFLTGREVHERAKSARRPSESSASSEASTGPPAAAAAAAAAAAVKSSPVPPVTAGSASSAIAAAARRRSSGSARGSGGLFSGLVASRDSDETNARRESWKDVAGSTGTGLFAGFFSPGGGAAKK